MADAEVLQVEVREDMGKRKVRRLRAGGKIPAVIYGHGEKNVSLCLAADEMQAVLRRGSRVVKLQGGLDESAFIRDVQWDTFGNAILHVDFTRVSAGETIDATVTIELRGAAPGVKAGGTVEQPLHELQIRCPSTEFVDKIEVNINALELGQTITVAQLELPKGATALADDDILVVQCVERDEAPEEDIAPVGSAEPEVIGRKAEDDDEGDS